jgi:hypothetical protein
MSFPAAGFHARNDRHKSPQPQTLPHVALSIVRGQARQRYREVTGPVYLIGGALDCDLVLGDPRFPAAYAYLYVSGNGVTLRKLSEGPELLLRGSTVGNAASSVIGGDLIECGSLAFRVNIEADRARREQRLRRFRVYEGPEAVRHDANCERRVSA